MRPESSGVLAPAPAAVAAPGWLAPARAAEEPAVPVDAPALVRDLILGPGDPYGSPARVGGGVGDCV